MCDIFSLFKFFLAAHTTAKITCFYKTQQNKSPEYFIISFLNCGHMCLICHKTAYRTKIHIVAKSNGSRKARSNVVESFQAEFCLSSNCFRYSGKCFAQISLRLWRMNLCFACTYIHSNVRRKPNKMTGILISDIGEVLDDSIPTTARSTDSVTTKEFTKLLKIVITLLRYCQSRSICSGV